MGDWKRASFLVISQQAARLVEYCGKWNRVYGAVHNQALSHLMPSVIPISE